MSLLTKQNNIERISVVVSFQIKVKLFKDKKNADDLFK